MEGYLKSCKGFECEFSCCSRGYGENIAEFLQSPRKKLYHILQENGIAIEQHPGDQNFVRYRGCSDGKDCKILKLFPDEDIRSLACKIFPYKVLSVSGGGITKETVGIYVSNCPATQPDMSVPQAFTDEAKALVKHHYLEVYNKEVDVIEIEKPQFC